MPLDPAFLARPIAHRALHDRAAGRIENSRAALRAAVEAGYPVEIDVQPSADGIAMVFHDEDLRRLTGREGRISELTAAELGRIPLLGSAPEEAVPTLSEVLEILGGKVPLLIEIKDQSGHMGPEGIGVLEAAVVEALKGYQGPVAAMSFNPHSVAWLRDHAPDLARGLVSYDYKHPDEAAIPPERRARLAAMEDFDAVGAEFVSYGAKSFPSAALTALKRRGVPVLCWTIRGYDEIPFASLHADQITFEGFRP